MVRSVDARKPGKALKINLAVVDRASGVKSFWVSFGDKTKRSRVKKNVHTYRRAGTYTLMVRTVDKAGNVGRKKVKLRIGKGGRAKHKGKLARRK